MDNAIRVCPWIAAFGRGRVGLTVARRNVIFDASLQPGTGSGVGGKGRWTAIAVPPHAESAGGRGKIAVAPRSVTDMVIASGMPPGPARVRASLYVHARVLLILRRRVAVAKSAAIPWVNGTAVGRLRIEASTQLPDPSPWNPK